MTSVTSRKYTLSLLPVKITLGNAVADLRGHTYYTAMRLRFLPIILAVLCCQSHLLAQSDTLILKESTPLVQALKPRRSPMGALLRSVAIPGWGQYYNHKYVKSAIVFGAESFFIAKSIHWWKKTEDQYDKVQSSESGRDFTTYINYRDRRNDYLWLTGLAVFLSMFDAYVDAHLSGFDVDLTPDFQAAGAGAAVRLTYSF